MTYRGHVKNGVIVFDVTVPPLPEGSVVDISPISDEKSIEVSEDLPSLYEAMKPFIGMVDDLPADLSINHDHYLYGTPKQTP